MNASDILYERYLQLSQTVDIFDMTEYAKDWQRLGNDAARLGLVARADQCYSHAKHYSEIEGGNYYRIVDGCLAELIAAAPTGTRGGATE